VIVGRSDLENRDASGRVVSGVFRPGLGYELVQPVFELYEQAAGDGDVLVRYRRSREALKLQLTDSSGVPIDVRELHIGRSGGSLVLRVETDDPSIWGNSAPDRDGTMKFDSDPN
jgi:hypothetical protein